MTISDEDREAKLIFIEAFFEEFERRIERLPKLLADSFKDEALTLCVVYIDHLASGHFGGDQSNNENFSRALRTLSGDSLFAMIHPRDLLEKAAGFCHEALPLLESVVQNHPNALLEEALLRRAVQESGLAEPVKQKLNSNLWRASIASICYSHIRGQLVHGPGSGGLLFEDSLYKGKVGVKVDFDLLYRALRSIYDSVKTKSLQNAEWFGNPSYPDRNKTG